LPLAAPRGFQVATASARSVALIASIVAKARISTTERRKRIAPALFRGGMRGTPQWLFPQFGYRFPYDKSRIAGNAKKMKDQIC
jgi:hypothetical protein